MNYQLVVALISILLTLVAYVPYILDTVRGTTRPHAISWLIWSLLGFVVFILQIHNGAGYGSWITGTVLVIQLLIFSFSIRTIKRDVTRYDICFLLLAILGIVIWHKIENDTVSMICVVFISLIGYIPTVKKIARDPGSETLSTYTINSFRHGFGILSLQQYNLITIIHPATWALINAMIASYIWICRKHT